MQSLFISWGTVIMSVVIWPYSNMPKITVTSPRVPVPLTFRVRIN
jgi:hypothetical protein